MNPDTLRALLGQAALAPSVHNTQPARWRIEPEGVTLFEDTLRRLPAGDPSGRDAAMSLGAAAEGLRLAASRAGLRAVEEEAGSEAALGALRPVMRFRFEEGGAPDPLAEWLERRQSWRGAFPAPDLSAREAAQALAGEDARVLTGGDRLGEIARGLDEASWRFMRDTGFRRELLSWMRLSPRHPGWHRDGLNAEAMAMGRLEALGARFVLGPGFGLLEKIGLAKPILSERQKTAGATAVVLFHRPAGEDPFRSGARFHRLWLRIEQAGFGAAVLAALADDPEAAARLGADLPSGHRLVSAFRIGRRPPDAASGRARLPLDEILVR